MLKKLFIALCVTVAMAMCLSGCLNTENTQEPTESESLQAVQ